MGSLVNQKPHAVLVPFPAQGHVNPLMQLAKLLHSRGFHITFVNTEFNHKRLIRSKGSDAVKGSESFKFETIPDGLPPSDKDATQHVPSLCYSTQKTCLAPFIELLNWLNSSPDVPPVTCVVADGVMGFGIDAAKQLGIPDVQFWTASACGFMGYLYFRLRLDEDFTNSLSKRNLSDLVKRGIVPFKDESYISDGTLEMPIDWIPGMPNIRLKDIPDFIRTTDPNDIMLNFLGGEAEKCLKASNILINTFNTFEHEVLEAIKGIYPNIYTAGPLSMLVKHVPDNELNSFRSSLWKEDTTCFEWLDKWEPESVVYVNYGCTTLMSNQHLQEFAWGLANSKHPFLWIVRPDIVMGDTPILSQEFLDEIQGRALLISWCPQDEVLCHPSVGSFLSHCGWNSTIESVCGGVPMICWPFFSEQCTNCRYACDVWGIGMELQHDVKRQEVEAVVREMMESEKGKKVRKKAQEWKKEVKKATDIGGSSYVNFDKFIKEALHFQ